MNTKLIKIICVVLIAAVTLVPAIIAGVTGNYFSEDTSRIFLTIAILLLAAFVMVDFKSVSKTKQRGKIAACVGFLYVLITQWT